MRRNQEDKIIDLILDELSWLKEDIEFAKEVRVEDLTDYITQLELKVQEIINELIDLD
jgi:hypothetical protein